MSPPPEINYEIVFKFIAIMAPLLFHPILPSVHQIRVVRPQCYERMKQQHHPHYNTGPLDLLNEASGCSLGNYLNEIIKTGWLLFSIGPQIYVSTATASSQFSRPKESWNC